MLSSKPEELGVPERAPGLITNISVNVNTANRMEAAAGKRRQDLHVKNNRIASSNKYLHGSTFVSELVMLLSPPAAV
jgi:hypothetical protein